MNDLYSIVDFEQVYKWFISKEAMLQIYKFASYKFNNLSMFFVCCVMYIVKYFDDLRWDQLHISLLVMSY